MTHPLSEIQAGYEQRAAQALQASVSPATLPERRKGTRTYTGQSLAARRAWGQQWAGIQRAVAQSFQREAV